ncbi:MAG: flavodoxin family protein [Casimicrobiaceae bacterium]|nr:flavodoxin family protein [Casimicrobiaceae bacterium]MCX8097470.1 flavodoxin family protein [Casimicrobiaceae bacterium]MDW8311188.1 flavodoxin family protein [Burkholderiales bacterium]
MPIVSIVYHSGYGHTKAIAEAVAEGARSVAHASVHLIAVAEAERHWETLAASDAIIFGSPTYMGGPSGPMKEWIDKTSKVWFAQGWKDKLAAGFTVSGSWYGDKQRTIDAFYTLAMQHGMLWVGTGLMPSHNSSKPPSPEDLNRVGSFSGLMVQANIDQGAEGIPATDYATARAFGARVATIASRWAGRI